MTKFYIYFPAPIDRIENIIVDRKSFSDLIEEIQMTVDRISCEINTDLCYDKSNKDNFVQELKALRELTQIGHFDIDEILNLMIIDNRIKKVSNKHEIIYRYYISENNETLEEDPIDLFKAMTENNFNNSDEAYCIMNFTYPTFPLHENIKISRNDAKTEPIIFNIHFIKGFKVDSFFNDINVSRKLNREDFRHCENHSDFLTRKSPLIGGTNGFDNAEVLLKSAIGDIKTGKEILINIDNTNDDYIIRYENENFNNQHHAYHIVKNNGGSYVEDKEKMLIVKSHRMGIPRAFRLLEYRKKLINLGKLA